MSGITDLSARMKEAGYKLTPARQAVIQVLESERRHLSPAEVLALGREIHTSLSRATVYRTLDLLTEIQAIRPIVLEGSCQRYMSGQGGHHHLVCINCESVVEFEECLMDELSGTLSDKYAFEVISHLLEFRGLCEACREGRNRHHPE